MINKKRLKFKRLQKKRVSKNYSFWTKNSMCFGKYALKSKESGILTRRQVEAVRRSITRRIKKLTKLWIVCRVNRPVTSKPLGIRMGKGKGGVTQKTRFVNRGSILFEIANISKVLAVNILSKVKKKLPINSYFVFKGR